MGPVPEPQCTEDLDQEIVMVLHLNRLPCSYLDGLADAETDDAENHCRKPDGETNGIHTAQLYREVHDQPQTQEPNIALDKARLIVY